MDVHVLHMRHIKTALVAAGEAAPRPGLLPRCSEVQERLAELQKADMTHQAATNSYNLIQSISDLGII